jgi:hypothetical protein
MSSYTISDRLRAAASDASNPGEINITDGIGGSITVVASQDTSSYTLSLPSTNGAVSDVLTSEDDTGSMVWSPPPAIPTFNVWYFTDTRLSGINAGDAPTAFSWLQRVLNTTTKPAGTGTEAALSGSSIILDPGVWWIEAYTPFNSLGMNTGTRIIETVSQNVLAYGLPTYSASSVETCVLSTFITVDVAPLSIDLEYQVTGSFLNNLGLACGFGEPETYTVVKVTLVG